MSVVTEPTAFNWGWGEGQGGRGRKRERELYMIAEFPCNEGINLILGIALEKKNQRSFSVNKQYPLLPGKVCVWYCLEIGHRVLNGHFGDEILSSCD